MKSSKRVSVSPEEAKRLILAGEAPDGLVVQGTLDLSEQKKQITLPAEMTVGTLKLNDTPQLGPLPSRLRCQVLELRKTEIDSLPDDLDVEIRLDLNGCTKLGELPTNLTTGSLSLRGCSALTALPEGLTCYFLDITDCTGIRSFPKRGTIQYGRLIARNCTGLRELPAWLTNVSQLDLCGCAQVESLPSSLRVSSWLDLADTGVRSLPTSLDKTELRWRGVRVPRHIVLEPESIAAVEVVEEANVEVRRVMLERMGFERFLTQAEAEELDADVDAQGGRRRLLRVPLKDDEPLVCVSVVCPSTARHYLIRVPPTMTTCQQAVAWTAGFDNPDDYRPSVET